MKIMKKILASVLTLAMMLSVIPASVSAATVDEIYEAGFVNWKVRSTTNNTAWTSNDYIKADFNNARTGNSSAHVVVTNTASNEGNRYLQLSGTTTEQMKNGTAYRLNLYYKGEGSGYTTIGASAAANGGTTRDIIVSANKKETGADGWTRYQVDFTPNSNTSTFNVNVILNSNCYFDDLSVQKITVADGETTLGQNILVDGGFEQTYLTSASDEYKNNDWSLTRSNGVTDATTHYAYVTDADAKTGKKALYINKPTNNAGGYIEMVQQNKVDFEAKTYVLEVDTKGDNAHENALRVRINWDTQPKLYHRSSSVPAVGDDGWRHWKKEFTVTSAVQGATVAIISEHETYVTLDNLTIYAKDDASKTNLLKDGGFEGSYITSAPVVENSDWQVVYTGSTVENDKANHYATVTSKDSYESNMGLFINYKNALATSTYIRVRNNKTVTFEKNKSYTLELYAKGVFGTDDTVDPMFGWNNRFYLTSSNGVAVGNEGWKKYTWTFTPEGIGDDKETADHQLEILVQRTAYMTMDNISLYETNDVNKTNLLLNGDFEGAKFKKTVTFKSGGSEIDAITQAGDIEVSAKIVKITNESINPYVIIASYESGNLAGISINNIPVQDESGLPATELTTTVTINGGTGSREVKVMFWEDISNTLMPIGYAESIYGVFN